MCWPGPHQQNCEERLRNCTAEEFYCRSSDKLQGAVYYAIDGDQVDILELLSQQGDDHWLPWQQKRPLLHIACERGAWNCVKYLVVERSDEINQCYDEYYPVHQSTLHDIKFLGKKNLTRVTQLEAGTFRAFRQVEFSLLQPQQKR